MISLVLGTTLLVGAATPEDRALAYLAREVPAWAADNQCYSCHNNGDAARALYTAVRLGRDVPGRALADTTAWLRTPERWDQNKGDPAVSDKKLARIQFAAALVDAVEAGRVAEHRALTRAAALVAEGQAADGSWPVDSGGAVGSPATYGVTLATALARRTLQKADPAGHREALARAERWLERTPPQTVLDAAGTLLGLEGRTTPEAAAQGHRCREILYRGQSQDGGWGPYVTAAPEPFDTAVALLALQTCADEREVRERIRRGREFLARTQQTDGSWPETTRPAGGESYAQHVSTTGWATLALLLTAPPAAATPP